MLNITLATDLIHKLNFYFSNTSKLRDLLVMILKSIIMKRDLPEANKNKGGVFIEEM